jgi:hypothetical protein
MASPHQPRDPNRGDRTDSRPVPYDEPQRRRVRVAVWDVTFTVAIWTVFVVVATTTNLRSLLFGFVSDVCPADDCAPVPFGIDYYIYPVVWGGIGAAFSAAVIGPFVSLVKGWYMFFWPLMAIALVILSSAAGSALTAFSERYWH